MTNDADIFMGLDQGTLILRPGTPKGGEFCRQSDRLVEDRRADLFRAYAHEYADSYLAALDRSLVVKDEAKDYQSISLSMKADITPRPHQQEALQRWLEAGRRGVVELPTGSGKTILAMLAIAATGRPTLILVPTIDLLMQWQKVIAEVLGETAGVLGGGEKSITERITVSTFDSALIYVERLQGKFGLLIVDECHHIAAPQYLQIAQSLIAPFRLGLSATVDRPDGKQKLIFEVLGEDVYRGKVSDMVDTVLSPYDVHCIEVPLTESERQTYKEQRQIYTGFLGRHNIRFGSGRGWMDFVYKAARLPGGKAAMAAYRQQKSIALGSSNKLAEIWRLLRRHSDERIIIFTNDNELAYRIGKQYLLPVVTHQTKLKERKIFLEMFKDGRLKVMVTSKVLNEGVDVPEASVGIIVSGSSGVREHVQRLGRILRQKPGKRATLYELVSKDTAEQYINQRRRQHDAYQRAPAD